MTRALEDGAHAVAACCAGALVGFAFLDQDAAGVPGRAGVRARLPASRRRPRCAGGSCSCSPPAPRCVVAGGWWVAIVELWPGVGRPYIGGSQNNSVLELIFGYNGLGRITGNETGSVGGGRPRAAAAASGARPGSTGCSTARWAAQISWLLPAALILLVAGLWLTAARAAHRPRAGPRAAVGRLAVVTGLVFSFMPGHHPPVLHRRAGAGDRRAGRHRRRVDAGGTARPAGRAVVLAASRSPSPRSGRTRCSAARRTGSRGCAPLVLRRRARGRGGRRCSPPLRGTVGRRSAGVAAGARRRLAAPAAYARGHRARRRTPARSRRPGPRARCGGPRPAGSRWLAQGRERSAGGRLRARAATGFGRAAGFRRPGFGPGMRPTAGRRPAATARRAAAASAACSTPATPEQRRSSRCSKQDATATAGSRPRSARTAPPARQLATGEPVMAIGGFNGTDPSPTLAQFQQLRRRREDPLLHRRRQRRAVSAGSARAAARGPARSPAGSRAPSRHHRRRRDRVRPHAVGVRRHHRRRLGGHDLRPREPLLARCALLRIRCSAQPRVAGAPGPVGRPARVLSCSGA